MRTRLRLFTIAPLAAAGLFITATPAFAAVSSEQAGQIVVDAYGGTVISVESDSENGVDTWEVEVEGSSQGRIEVDVNKETGDLVACEPEDGEGSCLGTADGGAAGGDTDDGDTDNGDTDNGTGGGESTGGGSTGGGGQMGTTPSGGVETGGGATSGVEHAGLLALGGAALAGAGGVGAVALRRRAAVRS